MKTGRILFVAGIVVLTLAAAGCPTEIPAAVIIGNLGLDISAAGPAHGGDEYHVLLFAPGAVVNISDLSSQTPVLSITGTLPGSAGDNYNKIPYVFPEVPEGAYFMFAWVDMDGDDAFDFFVDYFGFYDWDPTDPKFGNPVYVEDEQPASPNVPVPATGVLDIEFNLTVYVT